MFTEGNAAFPVGCYSQLQIVMVVWHASFLKKVCQPAITIFAGLPHLTRSLSRIVFRGQEGYKGSKDTLRPDFRPMLDLGFKKKIQCHQHHKIKEGGCKEILV